MDKFERFLTRAEIVLERIEGILPPTQTIVDWSGSNAFQWRKKNGYGFLQKVQSASSIKLSDLHSIDRQKKLIEQNTRQFIQKKPANNVLLTGARGTGKSSLIKACLNTYASDGLRLIEINKNDLHDLGEIIDLVTIRPERFIIFCDDLSFENSELGYKLLKVVLDGSITVQSDNMLVYATSNRRHILPEYMSDNEAYRHQKDAEIHPSEVVEEKISLSERFGLWINFYPFNQVDYLSIVAYWLRYFGCKDIDIEASRGDALIWALDRGSRSGRVAWQFARDWAGRKDNV
ncbi:MAG: ATP-binding protein [Burkholderia sp.]|nr:ATP-binding protein [Burkholderia sp.]